MAIESRQRRRRRRLVPGQIPDPLRAHGAWAYLVVSIAAGTLAVRGRGFLTALLAGGAFVGVFVAAGSVAAVGRGVAARRFALGLLVMAGCTYLALALGAERLFLAVSLLAVPPALAAAYFAWRDGFLSPGALGWGVTTLAVSAPAAASAGGAPPPVAMLVLAILAPFYFWRTRRLARALGPGWTRERFERQGLLELALVVAWAVVAVVAARLAQL